MINLQTDNTGRRTNTADYETEGGEVEGLSNEELRTFVEMLELEEQPRFYREVQDNDDMITIVEIYYSPVIDSCFYESTTDGGFWGQSSHCGICTEEEATEWIQQIDEEL